MKTVENLGGRRLRWGPPPFPSPKPSGGGPGGVGSSQMIPKVNDFDENHENHKKSSILSSTSPFEAESQFLEVVTVKVILKTILKEIKMTKTIKRRKRKRTRRIVNISLLILTPTLTTLPVELPLFKGLSALLMAPVKANPR